MDNPLNNYWRACLYGPVVQNIPSPLSIILTAAQHPIFNPNKGQFDDDIRLFWDFNQTLFPKYTKVL